MLFLAVSAIKSKYLLKMLATPQRMVLVLPLFRKKTINSLEATVF